MNVAKQERFITQSEYDELQRSLDSARRINAQMAQGGLNRRKRIEELEANWQQALYLLIHAYLTVTRLEYEDGMTYDEFSEAVCAFLWNHGLQPSLPEHNPNVRKFLGDYQAKAETTLPSADQILERMSHAK